VDIHIDCTILYVKIKENNMTGMTIDYETADLITKTNLKESLNYLETELRNHFVNGAYMHPEDVYHSQNEYIPALKTIIQYYGG
jgi:hypothetical protein